MIQALDFNHITDCSVLTFSSLLGSKIAAPGSSAVGSIQTKNDKKWTAVYLCAQVLIRICITYTLLFIRLNNFIRTTKLKLANIKNKLRMRLHDYENFKIENCLKLVI